MENTVYVKTWFLKKIETERHVVIYSFVGTVLKETEKAVYVKFDEAYNHNTGADYIESWVPKSCLLPLPAQDPVAHRRLRRHDHPGPLRRLRGPEWS